MVEYGQVIYAYNWVSDPQTTSIVNNDGEYRCCCSVAVYILLTTCLTAKVKQVFSWEDDYESHSFRQRYCSVRRRPYGGHRSYQAAKTHSCRTMRPVWNYGNCKPDLRWDQRLCFRSCEYHP